MLSKNQLKLVRSLDRKKCRQQSGLFVAEGPKVVADLLRAGFEAATIFSVSERPGAQAVTDEELRRLSFLQHPQDVLALFRIPTPPAVAPTNADKLSLALDGIQDPGNLGTIIRIADWFGISTVYCSPDTADIYSPKVVQATMGSLAHVAVVYCSLPHLLSSASCPVYGTLLDGDDIYCSSLSRGGILVMGNEGRGLSPEVRALVSHRLLIPRYGTSFESAESLNVAVATAVCCAEFRRRL